LQYFHTKKTLVEVPLAVYIGAAHAELRMYSA